MKIIQVMPFFGLGGAETMCENLVYELKKMGHQVIVVSLYNKQTPITERLEKMEIDIRYLNKKEGFDISLFNRLRKLFKQEKPDVIHTHIYTTKYVFPIAAQLKIRVVHTVHNLAEKENGKLGRKLNKFFFKHCHLIPVALSELIRDSIVKEYDIDEDRIPVIYNGIDLSKCQTKTDYSVDGNFRILHIGRFYEQKNHTGLLQAFKLFHEKHINTELWLIGDGEKRVEIENYVAKNNLTSCVRLLGLQSYVYGYLHDADMFTLPSNYEGIPMTIVEAMGSGMPIVATMVGGIPDMLDDESALLVPVDTKAIAEAFEKYYTNTELRERHGKNALVLSDKFSARTMAERYYSIYKRAR